jgi:tetratricopeptide (TPR) repeat protein
MKKHVIGSLLVFALTALACEQAAAQANLSRLVKKIQPAVATVIVYDVDLNIAGIGTGFFVNRQGHLITNFHVLAGRYAADVRTAAGKSYPVKAVLAENKEADLLKLEVAIPPSEIAWVPVSDALPEIAERVVVVGSPMGLEQTVSEGIVSSIRDLPPVGTVFQMSAPISPGSSGSPVVSTRGQVVGIATFQFVQGQNLNFAVAARQILTLRKFEPPKSVSEWTFAHLNNTPRAVEALCQKGFSFSINGEDRKAVDYFKKATEEDPKDATAWSGLGSCYAGLANPEEAIAAYRQAVEVNPADETTRFYLANYYGKIGRYDDAIAAYREAIRINPRFEAAHFNLGVVFSRLGRHEEGKNEFEAVIRLNPEAASAYYNAGISYTELGRYQEAIAAQENALRLNPDFAPAYYAIGAAYAKLGKEKEGFTAYTDAIRTDPDFAPAHVAIGEALLNGGDKGAALEEYKILKKLDPALAEDLFKRIYPNDEPSPKPARTAEQPKP